MAKKLCIFLFCLSLFVFTISCSSKKHHKRHINVVHLKDGRYTYKEKYKTQQPGSTFDGNDWIVWYWLMTNNNSSYYTSSSPSASSFIPPKGTDWMGSNISTGRVFTATPPTPEELENPIETVTEDLITDQYGHPEVDADGNLVDPSEISMEPDAPSTPADGDVGSVDSSGSGGDSSSSDGGDGGGGGD